MFKTLLVPLFGQAGDKEALELAYDVLGDEAGHINCLYVHDDAATIAASIQTDAMGVPIATPEFIAALNQECAALKIRGRQTFDRFCEAHRISNAAPVASGGGHSTSWQEVNGGIVQGISRAAHCNDAVVLKRGPGFSEPTFVNIGKIAIAAGRPLLVFPDHWPHRPLRHIVIAWKDTPEAARAVSSALPLLKKAKRILIISASESDNLQTTEESANACAAFLRGHGLQAETRCIETKEEDAEYQVFSEAVVAEADLFVMGTYGHSRVQELIFGGFTRRALQESAIPLLLMH